MYILENKSSLRNGIYIDKEYNETMQCYQKLLHPILKVAKQKTVPR